MSGAGAVVGLFLGVGLLFVALASSTPRPERGRPILRSRVRTARAAGSGTSSTLVLWSAGAALVAGLLALTVTALPVVALLAAIAGGALPVAIGRRRRAATCLATRAAWPDAVDHLLSSVRAGLGLADALADVGRSGPAPLRPAFARFADEYRVTGAFGPSLDALQDDLADPVADRVCAALRLAREVGGTDLGVVLGTLSAMLREQDRIRGEIEGRQSWAVNAARLAVAAPWLTLALLCTRPEAVRAYTTPAGTVVLVVAASLSVAAYLTMRRIGRLPLDERMAA